MDDSVQSWIPQSVRGRSQVILFIAITCALLGGKLGSGSVNLGHILAFMIVLFVLREFTIRQNTDLSTFQGDMDKQLTILDPKNQYPYLVTDLTLVHLLYLSRLLEIGQEETYAQLLTTVNRFLQLSAEIYCDSTLDKAAEFEPLRISSNLICNTYHALIYSVDPTTNQRVLYQRCLDQLRLHLNEKMASVRLELLDRTEKESIRSIKIPSLKRPLPLNSSIDSSLVERNFHFFST